MDVEVKGNGKERIGSKDSAIDRCREPKRSKFEKIKDEQILEGSRF